MGDLILEVLDHPLSESLGSRPNSPPQGGLPGGGGGFGGGGGGLGGGGGFFSIPDRLDSGSSSSATTSAAVTYAVGGSQLASIQFCQFGGIGAGQPAGVPDVNRSIASISIDDIIRVISTTVERDTWANNGTGDGEIDALGTALVIWQTAEVHEVIQDLLTQIRQTSAQRQTATVDARWLLLNSGELDRLLVSGADGVPLVKRDVLAQFTQRAGSIRGITNCFSGQLVYLVSGTRRNVVTSFIPVVGSVELPDSDLRQVAQRGESLFRLAAVNENSQEGNFQRGVGYQPVVATPNFGTALEIRPTLVPGSDTAIVDLKSTVTSSAEDSTGTRLPVGTLRISPAPSVDRLAIETQELMTTLRIPRGKPVLVGGLSYAPAVNSTPQTAGPAAENPQLYLVLEVR